MGTPREHSIASPSASERWLNCTAAPTFEAQFPDGDPGEYAKKGTLAHRICELTVAYNNGDLTKRKFNSQLKKCREDPLFEEGMIKTADFYASYIWEKAMSYTAKPFIALEDRVDLSEWIPEGFGSCDCIMIGDDHLHITDYKNGSGVVVDAKGNTQMRLYALGALRKYQMFYSIKNVSMAIVQPNVTEDVTEDTLTVDELLAWGEWVKPIAKVAVSGEGAQFKEGDWCRFCKGKAACRARAVNMTALADFSDIPIEGRMSDQEKADRETAIKAGFQLPVLTDDEVADLLHRGARLVTWYNDLKDYALESILAGRTIPGWKAVAGRSIRKFDDVDAALDEIRKAGYDDALLYDRKPKTLAALEKMLGKTEFATLVGSHIVKPMGAPTLVDESDARESYSSAASDFSEATQR